MGRWKFVVPAPDSILAHGAAPALPLWGIGLGCGVCKNARLQGETAHGPWTWWISRSGVRRCSSSRSELDPGEAAVGEAGSMMFMDAGIQMDTVFGDGSAQQGGLFGKLLGAASA